MHRIIRRWAIVTALIALALVLRAPGASAAWDGGSASADVTEAAPGDTVTITASIAWDGSGGIGTSAGVDFSATVPAAFASVSWICSGENVVCTAESGSGSSIAVSAGVTDSSLPATATLTITAIVAEDAAPGAVDIPVCALGSVGELRSSGTRALPNLQEGCSTVTVTIAEEPTPTPEPTETATAEPTPATPIVIETETPGPAAPTQAAGPVTQLPSTGAGDGSTNQRVLAAAVAIALAAMAVIGVAGVRVHRR